MALKKIVFEKKLEAFKKLAEANKNEVLISKAGNYYFYLNGKKPKRNRTHNCWSVTKTTIKKLGTHYQIPDFNDTIYLLTKTGSLFIKRGKENFQKLKLGNYSGLNSEEMKYFVNCIMINKKNEWMKNYFEMTIPLYHSYINFMSMKLMKGFSSEKEFMHFFGMGQHTFKKFYDFLFTGTVLRGDFSIYLELLIQNKNRGEESKNQWLFTSIPFDVKTDILNMQRQLGEPLKIFEGRHAMDEEHNRLVALQSKKNCETDNSIYRYKSNFFDNLRANDITRNFVIHSTMLSMYLTGTKQGHCYYTRRNSIRYECIFMSFFYEDKQYDFQISLNNSTIVEGKGIRNTSVPEILMDTLKKILQESEKIQCFILAFDFAKYGHPLVEPNVKMLIKDPSKGNQFVTLASALSGELIEETMSLTEEESALPKEGEMLTLIKTLESGNPNVNPEIEIAAEIDFEDPDLPF